MVSLIVIILSRHGVCEKCDQHLKLFQLSNQDFKELREAFLQRAVMKSDIYINTTTREFRKYMEFIDAFKPFHIVLDGLNAAYSHKGFLSKSNLSKHVSLYFLNVLYVMLCCIISINTMLHIKTKKKKNHLINS